MCSSDLFDSGTLFDGFQCSRGHLLGAVAADLKFFPGPAADPDFMSAAFSVQVAVILFKQLF